MQVLSGIYKAFFKLSFSLYLINKVINADIQDILVELACVEALPREAGVLFCNIITVASTEQLVIKKCVFLLVDIEVNFVSHLKIVSLD